MSEPKCRVCGKSLSGTVAFDPRHRRDDQGHRTPSYLHPSCAVLEKARMAAEKKRIADAAPDLLAAAEAVLASLRAGLGEITGQGVRSPAFQSRADETAAALRDLKAAVAKARGA
jgi:hypothetical protein